MLFPFVFIVNVCSTLLCTFFVCLSCAVVSVRSVRFGREPPAALPPTAGYGLVDVVDYIFREDCRSVINECDSLSDWPAIEVVYA
mmetsp:Transcript_73164/g.122172  ORF Transcript_73164/g.122172 Transcript_73164/m.122172 type:complete len:85 (-) Transcript_73164:613-867(-)